jgi:hypothetical protein
MNTSLNDPFNNRLSKSRLSTEMDCEIVRDLHIIYNTNVIIP